jgi:hypothetical protein
MEVKATILMFYAIFSSYNLNTGFILCALCFML